MICIRTPTGSLTFAKPAEHERGACACGLPADVEIHPTIRGAAGTAILLCGKCLAGGLAIGLGHLHVRDGGNVADLQIPDDQEAPRP